MSLRRSKSLFQICIQSSYPFGLEIGAKTVLVLMSLYHRNSK